jgi:hypothetical protein
MAHVLLDGVRKGHTGDVAAMAVAGGVCRVG